jgi:hypothetical protein
MCAHDYASIKRRSAKIANPFLQFLQRPPVGGRKPAPGKAAGDKKWQPAGGQKQERAVIFYCSL